MDVSVRARRTSEIRRCRFFCVQTQEGLMGLIRLVRGAAGDVEVPSRRGRPAGMISFCAIQIQRRISLRIITMTLQNSVILRLRSG